jgi:multiple sugar transport system permease protein
VSLQPARPRFDRFRAGRPGVVARPTRRIPLSRKQWAAYAFISPAVIFLLCFAIGPILFAFYVSLHDWNMLTPVDRMPFVGPENYRYLLQEDPLFGQVLRTTFIYTIASVAIASVLGLSLAMALNRRVRPLAFWRAAYFLPIVTSAVAVSIVWSYLYNANYGLFNAILSGLGWPQHRFLSSPQEALPSLIAVGIWQAVGYYMVLFLAGLQGIPQEYYDAASVDGANAWRSFRDVTLPLLRPTLLFVLVVNTIGALQVFDIVYVMTGGGPVNATYTGVVYVYDTAFKFLRMGRATAMSFILFGIIFVITLAQLRLLRQGADD